GAGSGSRGAGSGARRAGSAWRAGVVPSWPTAALQPARATSATNAVRTTFSVSVRACTRDLPRETGITLGDATGVRSVATPVTFLTVRTKVPKVPRDRAAGRRRSR